MKYYIDSSSVVNDGWLILRDKDNNQVGSAHADNYDLRMKLYEKLKELNKVGRPSIPDDEKNILATFSLKRWQVARLKETKNKSKLIQYLLTKHFNDIP